MLATYHAHTLFCDGEASPDAMAEAAFVAGYRVLGFSAHAPVPLPSAGNLASDRVADYVRAVRKTAESYASRMEVLAGLELEWVPGLGIPSNRDYATVKLDFLLGSLHYVKAPNGSFFTVDCPEDEFAEAMASGYGGDGNRLYRDYYRELGKLIRTGGYDMLGHLDIIKKNNRDKRWFDDSRREYLDAVFEALSSLKGSNIVAEVNTGGMARGKIQEPYPSLPILKELRRLDVPVVIGADAHAPAHLDAKWRDLGIDWVRRAGYKELAVFSRGQWSSAPVE